MHALEACEPREVAAALRVHDFEAQADAISAIENMAARDRHSFALHEDLAVAQALASKWNRRPAIRHLSEQLYGALQVEHGIRLEEASRELTRFLIKRPGILYTGGEAAPEPLVRVEFVPTQVEPPAEARLAIHGLHGEIVDLSERGIRCDVTKFSKKIRRRIMPMLLSDTVEVD